MGSLSTASLHVCVYLPADPRMQACQCSRNLWRILAFAVLSSRIDACEFSKFLRKLFVVAPLGVQCGNGVFLCDVRFKPVRIVAAAICKAVTTREDEQAERKYHKWCMASATLQL